MFYCCGRTRIFLVQLYPQISKRRCESNNYKDVQRNSDEFYIDYHDKSNDYINDDDFNDNLNDNNDIIVPRRKCIVQLHSSGNDIEVTLENSIPSIWQDVIYENVKLLKIEFLVGSRSPSVHIPATYTDPIDFFHQDIAVLSCRSIWNSWIDVTVTEIIEFILNMGIVKLPDEEE
ncbi:hypothetical protein HZH68_002985 [Vespula germanica]|uniref:Uncharacterized protein n=1 Tax=Vespula germanica TaxID=30212 RepID=A0A834NNF8_VESGE|nr:hypothetical protein HZH68_002985 [Vespula germanica]